MYTSARIRGASPWGPRHQGAASARAFARTSAPRRGGRRLNLHDGARPPPPSGVGRCGGAVDAERQKTKGSLTRGVRRARPPPSLAMGFQASVSGRAMRCPVKLDDLCAGWQTPLPLCGFSVLPFPRLPSFAIRTRSCICMLQARIPVPKCVCAVRGEASSRVCCTCHRATPQCGRARRRPWQSPRNHTVSIGRRNPEAGQPTSIILAGETLGPVRSQRRELAHRMSRPGSKPRGDALCPS